jgi:hypothetical protein
VVIGQEVRFFFARMEGGDASLDERTVRNNLLLQELSARLQWYLKVIHMWISPRTPLCGVLWITACAVTHSPLRCC